MDVIRVLKTHDYTVMSNHHLRNKNLSLKAKGLQSFMLSLPDDWDLSVKGLQSCLKEGRDALYSAMNELIEYGYVTRVELKSSGKFDGIEYTVHEVPELNKPDQENPDQENPQQINTKIPSTELKEILTNSSDVKIQEKNWKDDYNVYLKDLKKDYNSLITDKEYITTQQKYNPGVDIKLTLEKAYVTYWATEAGWKQKKRKRIAEIDWKATFTNALSFKTNRVYLNKSNDVIANVPYYRPIPNS